jgi:heme-degrading monooxygenase HmoA
MAIYTLGDWTVKPGREEELVEAWRHVAMQTAADFPAPTATLLRDGDQPNRCISYGPWPSLDEIEAWRESLTFDEGVARIRAMVDGFEPHTMDSVVMIVD